MFSYDRETMLIAAVIVCVLGSLYLYREVRNAKQEITDVKIQSGQIAQYVSGLSYYEDEDEDGEGEGEEEVKVEEKSGDSGDLSAK
jgi:hypothetical protein